MISNRPYLIRAFHQWIVDSGCTPILVLDSTNPRCKIPADYSDGGEIVFNVSSTAIRDLKLANDCVEFKASFSGVIHLIHAPIKAVLALYAEENGEGIFLDAEEDDDVATTGGDVVKIKNSDNVPENVFKEQIAAETIAAKGKPVLTLVE